jgi:hypothetical protein
MSDRKKTPSVNHNKKHLSWKNTYCVVLKELEKKIPTVRNHFYERGLTKIREEKRRSEMEKKKSLIHSLETELINAKKPRRKQRVWELKREIRFLRHVSLNVYHTFKNYLNTIIWFQKVPYYVYVLDPDPNNEVRELRTKYAIVWYRLGKPHFETFPKKNPLTGDFIRGGLYHARLYFLKSHEHTTVVEPLTTVRQVISRNPENPIFLVLQ